MKYFFFAVAIFLAGCSNHEEAAETTGLQYDGMYSSTKRSNEETGDTYNSNLRFYKDGTVLSVSSDGTPAQLSSWFNKENDRLSRGTYKIDGDKINFSTTSNNATVTYTGTLVDSKTLKLHTSADNGNEADITFTYQAFPEE